jgi:hypothetical protein
MEAAGPRQHLADAVLADLRDRYARQRLRIAEGTLRAEGSAKAGLADRREAAADQVPAPAGVADQSDLARAEAAAWAARSAGDRAARRTRSAEHCRAIIAYETALARRGIGIAVGAEIEIAFDDVAARVEDSFTATCRIRLRSCSIAKQTYSTRHRMVGTKKKSIAAISAL